MDGNEVIIIFMAIIWIPLCLWLLIKIPNASKCGSCGQPLNIQRQKTYHFFIDKKILRYVKIVPKKEPHSFLEKLILRKIAQLVPVLKTIQLVKLLKK
jgi:hypothetical protein